MMVELFMHSLRYIHKANFTSQSVIIYEHILSEEVHSVNSLFSAHLMPNRTALVNSGDCVRNAKERRNLSICRIVE